MSTALAVKEMDPEQIALIKRTVAAGATNDELALFLFDCQRRGVHPLDKLLHFTKRNGKYTPITSIDFLRTRAHETGKCAGISDAAFVGEPRKSDFAATITVRRVVEGIVAEFTATARWDEYKPQQNDFMWTRMPHTMLGKCAEALALRKAFPQELAGLYTGDEMAQAGKPDAAEAVNTDTGEIVEQPKALAPPPTDDLTYIGLYEGTKTRKKGTITIYDLTIDGQKFSIAEPKDMAWRELEGQRVTATYKPITGGMMLTSLVAAPPEPVTSELAAEEVPF